MSTGFGRTAGRHRACRHFFMLIYATAVVYFFYAPWNYVSLGVLLLRRRTNSTR